MNMSVRALNPRIVRLSPAGTPPSPAWNVIPDTFRSTSRRLVAPCCSINWLVITVTVCGTSRSGSVYFGEESEGDRPLTSTDSETLIRSSATVRPSRKR
jgi:hypothetical protein